MNLYFQQTYQRSFGTFPLTGDTLTSAVAEAAKIGYRAFDTAQMYNNEAEVGAAIAALGLPRGEICITTKVHPDNFTDALFLASVEESLKKLGLDRVDALLLHWPAYDGDNSISLRLLQKAKRLGLADHIGISNYTSKMMREAAALLDEPIITNQVEFHPLLDQSILLKAATETGIPLASYCSVARGEVFKHPIFGEIGAGYGKTAAQTVLRWILQKGVPINTMSTKPDNIRANFDVMDFTLSSIDMDRIDAMRATGYRCVDKVKVPTAPEWD